MISQDPDTFSSAYQSGKERITITLTLPAETLANMRAVSYALGGLSVEQLIEGNLRVFMFMAPQDIIANLEGGWEWDDPEEQARIEEARAIAQECEVSQGNPHFWPDFNAWPAFRAEAAKLRPYC